MGCRHFPGAALSSQRQAGGGLKPASSVLGELRAPRASGPGSLSLPRRLPAPAAAGAAECRAEEGGSRAQSRAALTSPRRRRRFPPVATRWPARGLTPAPGPPPPGEGASRPRIPARAPPAGTAPSAGPGPPGQGAPRGTGPPSPRGSARRSPVPAAAARPALRSPRLAPPAPP